MFKEIIEDMRNFVIWVGIGAVWYALVLALAIWLL